MANIKVSEMTEATEFDDLDYAMIVQANQNKKIVKENLFKDIDENINNIETSINNLEELINESKRKDIITANLAANMSISTAGDIPLTNMVISSQIGDKLTLENGKVKIGVGITHVMVSAFESLTTSSAAGVRNVNIFKNNTGLKSAKIYMPAVSSGCSIVLPPILIPVQENDEINIVSYVRAGDRIDGGNAYTYFTVEAVKYE